MKAIVTAAGRGTRLWPITKECPKPLVPLQGRPIIAHVLEALGRAGIREVVVVTGYLGSMFRERLGKLDADGIKVQYVDNDAFDRGNGSSVGVAEKHVKGDDFLLLMGDHIIEPRIIGSLLSNTREFTLCVDRKPRFPPQLKDATRVLTDENGYIKRIGKSLTAWNGVDTGVFLCKPVMFDAIRDLSRSRHQVTISGCLRRLIQWDHGIRTHDVSGSFWLDIDTHIDLQFAEELMKKTPCQLNGTV